MALFYRLWSQKIKNLYVTENWFDNDGNRNPFAKLRDIVDDIRKGRPDYKLLYTGLASRKPEAKTETEYKKRSNVTRKYTITLTYEVEAKSEKEAEDMARTRIKNIKKLRVSDVD